METAFIPQLLAQDIETVRENYAAFFARLSDADWSRPAPRGKGEWNLRETVAHLCALTGEGNQSMLAALRGEHHTLVGLRDRYDFEAYNRREIDRQAHLANETLAVNFLSILDQARDIALHLTPAQLDCTASLPIYNRPVKVVEALGIQVFHPGLHHSAQVAEPAGLAPLWVHLPADVRQRIITRVMRALSLLYRFDLGGDLRATFAFEIAGPGGGCWRVDVSPHSAQSAQAPCERATFTIGMRSTDTFCRMFTGRINLLSDLLSGELRLKGDLRLFRRFGSLFSVDARQ